MALGASGLITCIAIPALLLIGLLAIVGLPGLIGLTAGACVAKLGVVGKNRNVKAAVLLGSLSASGALVALFFSGNLARTTVSSGELMSLGDFFDPSRPLFLVTRVIALVIAALFGGIFAWYLTAAHKFCERCQVSMTKDPLNGVSLLGLKSILEGLREQNIKLVSQTIQRCPGSTGKPMLFRCPSCGEGFFEMDFDFQASWKLTAEHDGSTAESWLVCSSKLQPEQTMRIRSTAGSDGSAEST